MRKRFDVLIDSTERGVERYLVLANDLTDALYSASPWVTEARERFIGVKSVTIREHEEAP